MGGNVTINGQSPVRVKLNNKKIFISNLESFLNLLNIQYKDSKGQMLWPVLNLNYILSGSTCNYLYHDNEIPDELFYGMGDLDIQVDKDSKVDIIDFLANQTPSDGSTHFEFIGHKKGSGICLYQYSDPINGEFIIQFDFEFVEYQYNLPSPWSRFIHSSNYFDYKDGIKGVFHKYLIRAVTHIYAKEYLLKDKKGNFYTELISPYSFSVPNGLRNRLKEHIENNLTWYEELKPTKDTLYNTNQYDILDILFRTNNLNIWEKFYIDSFGGVINLCNHYLTKEERKIVRERFLEIVCGEKAQAISKSEEEDKKFKSVAIKYLEENLHYND